MPCALVSLCAVVLCKKKGKIPYCPIHLFGHNGGLGLFDDEEQRSLFVGDRPDGKDQRTKTGKT